MEGPDVGNDVVVFDATVVVVVAVVVVGWLQLPSAVKALNLESFLRQENIESV